MGIVWEVAGGHTGGPHFLWSLPRGTPYVELWQVPWLCFVRQFDLWLRLGETNIAIDLSDQSDQWIS